MIDLSNRAVAKPAEKDRVKIGWSSWGRSTRTRWQSTPASARFAGCGGILQTPWATSTLIDQYDQGTRKIPKDAAKIARRLLATGRLLEAWQRIEAAEHPRRSGGWVWGGAAHLQHSIPRRRLPMPEESQGLARRVWSDPRVSGLPTGTRRPEP
jgi:hypothetical protein